MALLEQLHSPKSGPARPAQAKYLPHIAYSVSPARPISPSASSRLLFPAIFAATLAAYWPALRGGFVMDDDVHVTRAALRSWHGLWRIWSQLGVTEHYGPLVHSAFWLEHRLWGDAVIGYHLVNIAQHALAACLVVLILRKLAIPGAWLAGFAFALYPICVESVAWISEQKNTFSAVFYLAAALVYLQYDESRERKHYFWASALFLGALLSKPVTVTLPAALLVILWWKRGRLDFRRDIRPLAPWIAIAAAEGLFTAWMERTYMGAHGAQFALSFAQRLLLAGRLPFFYAAKLLLPINLSFTYPHWTVDPSDWRQWLYPLGLAALVLALLLLATKKTTTHHPSPTARAPLAATLFFIGTLFPVLGFLNVSSFRYSWAADHYQYLASLGLIVPFCALIEKAGGARQVLGPMLLVVLAVLTFRQSAVYRNAETLYRATIARDPESWLAYNNLGAALAQAGRTEEAIAEYQAALRIKPDYAEPHNNLAGIYSNWPGHLAEAIAEAQAAIRIRPDYAPAHVNLGSFLAQTGHLAAALAEDEAAIRMQPDFAAAHNNLGTVLMQLPNRLQDAAAAFRDAVELDPNYVQAHVNLGSSLARIPGRQEEALAEFRTALRIDPRDPRLHNSLGVALAQMPGYLPGAFQEFQTAVELKPDFAEAHNNLGRALSLMPGRMPDAVAEYRLALRLRPDYMQARMNLLAALQASAHHPE